MRTITFRRTIWLGAAACLLLAIAGCTASRQQRYREHLNASVPPSKSLFGDRYVFVDPDNP